MKITLLTVGKTTDVRLEALIDEYRERLKHYITFDFKVVSLSKSQQSASLSVERQKQLEGELILAACNLAPITRNPSPVTLILLDEHGKQFRSIEFADYLRFTRLAKPAMPLISVVMTSLSRRMNPW